MEDTTMADIISSPAEETVVEETTAPSQEETVLAEELERVEGNKPKRTKLEQLEYTKQRVEQQLAEERKKAGIPEDEDRPLTMRDFRAMQMETAQETALKLSDSIESEVERKLVQYHLQNTIKPSGDAATDLRNARLIVNSLKNGQIVEETLRTTKARTASSAASAPPKEQSNEELTPAETEIMMGMGLTKEQVIAARPKE